MPLDRRDSEALGRAYLERRAKGVPIHHAVMTLVSDYDPGSFMSSDPAEHHSQTPQGIGNLSDGADSSRL